MSNRGGVIDAVTRQITEYAPPLLPRLRNSRRGSLRLRMNEERVHS
jgi:hypothetical protein